MFYLDGIMTRQNQDWAILVILYLYIKKIHVLYCVLQVVISTHVPVSPGATGMSALTWNYEEVLSVLHKPAGLRCVVAVFAGTCFDKGDN